MLTIRLPGKLELLDAFAALELSTMRLLGVFAWFGPVDFFKGAQRYTRLSAGGTFATQHAVWVNLKMAAAKSENLLNEEI